MTDPATAYEPLARRYRPTRFEGPDGLVGQPHVSRTLKNAVRRDQVASAYLFAGPRGTGKTTTARLLAAALNCRAYGREAPDEPCGDCDVCRRIVDGHESHDVIEIDAASNRGVDDARELREQAQYAPSREDAHKVYILDEAHMMTREAWNALLKVIEEPPSRVHFCFCTTEPEKIEQTARPILSRCQRLDMRRLTIRDILDHLTRVAKTEGIEAEEAALVLLARRADGAMRDGLSLLDQLRAFGGEEGQQLTAETVREAFGLQPEAVYLNVVNVLAQRSRSRAFALVEHLRTQGADFVRFLEELQAMFGDLALAQEGGVPEGWSGGGLAGLMERAGRERADRGWSDPEDPLLTTAEVVEMMALIQEATVAIRRAPRPETVLLTTLQRAISLLERADGPR